MRRKTKILITLITLITAIILIFVIIGTGGYRLISNQMLAKNKVTTADEYNKYNQKGGIYTDGTQDTEITNSGIYAREGDVFYVCPMHQNVIQKEPGNCPICGMKLEKRSRGIAATIAKSSEEVATVQLSPAIIQMLGVKSEEVKLQRLIKEIRTAGRIDYNEKAIKVISARVPGRIDKLFVDFTGTRVKQGDPLLLLYSPDLVSAQQEYLIASASLEKTDKADNTLTREHEQAQALVNSSRRRLLLWGITDQQLKELGQKKNSSLHLTIHVPISGTVTQKNVVEGMYVSEGTPLYTIVDLSTVWMYAEVYEYELSWVKVGQDVKLSLPAHPGKNFQGKITFIDPILNPNTRTVRVRAEIKNQDSLLKPGMFADAFLQAVVGENLVAVPESAVIHSGERNMVILDQGNGSFTPREVEIGILAKGYYQVLSGVAPGDKVVTSANFLIDSESNLRTAVQMMGHKH